MAYFRPITGGRDVPIHPEQSAVLFVDVQNFNCHKDGALYAHLQPGDFQDPKHAYFFERMETTKPKWTRLQNECRKSGIEVMYTVIQSLTQDGRDRSKDYKISGFHVPPNSWDAKVLECIEPGDDEIVLPKTSSSVFQSTHLDYILRCMEKKHLVLCGCITDQCVDHAVRDGCDLGYHVTLITDCCATYSEERHVNALNANKGYCRQIELDTFCTELHSLPKTT